jgi:predicted ArsR family transcriptional regulator
MMTGTIRQLLAVLDEGGMTFAEVAARLGLGEMELRNRLDMMASMGHLEAVPVGGDDRDPAGSCPGCVFSSRCKEDTCSDGMPVVGYKLTDKGRRLARGTISMDKGSGKGDDDDGEVRR